MLLDEVRRSVAQHRLLSTGETVVVGVSGGPDSLCLLHVLCRLRAEYDLRLHVAHLHHGLRGADADADAEFVRALAGDWGLPCTVEQADVPALAAEHRLAVEEAARRARYAFLSRVAGTVGSRTIAVGHNADDQVETVLMHWLRGSGLAGLCGMLPDSALAETRLAQSPSPNLHLIRPLLEVTRTDIQAYCDLNGLEPRFDRSNLDTTYFRNWLRHEVIPLLAGHNPNVQEVLRRSARVIAGDYALLRSLLEEAWPQVVVEEEAHRIGFDRKAWRALPTGLQRSTLREAIHRLRRGLRNINFVHVEDAVVVAREGTTGARATLPQGLMLTVGYDRFTVASVHAAEVLPDWPLLPTGVEPLPVAIPGVTALPESVWMLRTDCLDRDLLPRGWEANEDPWRAYLDAQAVGPSLWLRTRQPGDSFQPLGLAGHAVKLNDHFTNQKVPRASRDHLPLLVDGQGIAWVCGLRLDERVRVRDSTRRVLVFRFVE